MYRMSLISAGSISLDIVPLRMFSINILSKFLGAKLHARGYVTHPAPCGDIRGGLSRVPRHPGQHSAAGIQSSLTHPGYPPQSGQSAKLFLQTLDWGLPHHLTRRRVPYVLPSFSRRGGGGGRVHTRLRERGWGRVPKREDIPYLVVGTLGT